VACPEERLVLFLAGELTVEQERDFDNHLLTCEQCWQAVQADRVAHAALERLREPAPAGLGERVALAVSSVPAPAPADNAKKLRPAVSRGRRRWDRSSRLTAAAATSAIVAAAGAAGWAWARSGPPADPPQVSAVVAMISTRTPPSGALRAGEQLMIDHQAMLVRAYEMKGGEALVATSMRPFPMPTSSHLVPGSSTEAWMATKGPLSMYGVNRPRGEQSMFLVAAMPMAELPQVAANLHLI